MKKYNLSMEYSPQQQSNQKNIFFNCKDSQEERNIILNKPYFVVGLKECHSYLRRQIKTDKKKIVQVKTNEQKNNPQLIHIQNKPGKTDIIQNKLKMCVNRHLNTKNKQLPSKMLYYSNIWSKHIKISESKPPEQHSIYLVAKRLKTQIQSKNISSLANASWQQTLRDQNKQQMERIKKVSFKVLSQGLKLKGVSKMQKQRHWGQRLLPS